VNQNYFHLILQEKQEYVISSFLDSISCYIFALRPNIHEIDRFSTLGTFLSNSAQECEMYHHIPLQSRCHWIFIEKEYYSILLSNQLNLVVRVFPFPNLIYRVVITF
jgi:hypothetical protein